MRAGAATCCAGSPGDTPTPTCTAAVQDQARATGLPPVERFLIPSVAVVLAPEVESQDPSWRRSHVLVTALTLCTTLCAAIVVATALLVLYVRRAARLCERRLEGSSGSMLRRAGSRRSVALAEPMEIGEPRAASAAGGDRVPAAAVDDVDVG